MSVVDFLFWFAINVLDTIILSFVILLCIYISAGLIVDLWRRFGR